MARKSLQQAPEQGDERDDADVKAVISPDQLQLPVPDGYAFEEATLYLERQATEIGALIQARVRRDAKAKWEIGRRLYEVRQATRYGGWEDWCRKKLRMSPSTAWAYIKFYKIFLDRLDRASTQDLHLAEKYMWRNVGFSETEEKFISIEEERLHQQEMFLGTLKGLAERAEKAAKYLLKETQQIEMEMIGHWERLLPETTRKETHYAINRFYRTVFDVLRVFFDSHPIEGRCATCGAPHDREEGWILLTICPGCAYGRMGPDFMD